MEMLVEQIVFYSFAALVVLSALMVISTRNTVKGALFLVLAFLASTVLWILLHAEFLALALIFVYVGAVMTLFLFVVMMLNLNIAPQKRTFVTLIPLGILLAFAFMGILIYVVGPERFGLADYAIPLQKMEPLSNVKALGNVLYTQYVYPFEIAGVLLLVAIIASITLAFRGKQHRKSQNISEQLTVRREDRVRLVKMQGVSK